MQFTRIKALWPERKDFSLARKDTGEEYIFLHLLTPAEFYLNGEWVRTKEGACILYDKHAHQEFSSRDCALLHDYFHLRGDLSEKMTRYGLQFGRIYFPRPSEQITSIIQQIEQETLKKAPWHEEFTESKLTELLILLARSSEEQKSARPVDAQTYERFVQLRREIHERFDSSLTVDSMAAMVNLSPSRFYSVYKNIFGISPKKDYLNIRIEHAKTLLQQGKYSVQQVASMVGYNNQYHFIRQFRQVTGATPGKYLKSARTQSK